MADIHILQKRSDGAQSLVLHFPVAVGENSVPIGAGGPVTWQNAVAYSQGGEPESSLHVGGPESGGGGKSGVISQEESVLISTGAVLERAYSYPMDSGGTTDALRASSLREFYARCKEQITAEIQQSLAGENTGFDAEFQQFPTDRAFT